jgi:signal peptidase II
MTIIKDKKKLLKGILALVSIGFLVLVDQWIKNLAKNLLSKYSTIPLIKDILHFTYVENFGAAFGILKNQKIFLVGVTAFLILCMILFIFSNKIKIDLGFWALCLIVSGGIGNLIDRVYSGFVVDYIDFRLIDFAVFNLADSYVSVGAVLLLIYYALIERREFKSKMEETEEVSDAK